MQRIEFLKKMGFGAASALVGLKSTIFARNKKKISALDLDQDVLEFETPNFNLKLVRASQTIAALVPKGADGFDFTPADWLDKRSGDGYYHLGDVVIRLRTGKSGKWTEYSTAVHRSPVKSLNTSQSVLAASELNPTLPADFPLSLRRIWKVADQHLVLSFELENISDQAIEIGSFGIPMIFNNILTKRTLEEAHHKCSFYDPYIGQDAGYLQVTRLNGHGPALVVAPAGKTPLEAYKPLLSDKTQRNNTFEGFYEWMAHTKAYAENEWKDAEHWNPPTSETLKPGQKRTYGINFLLSDKIQNIEDTLRENKRPVAVGVPGYVLPMDQNSRLFLDYHEKVNSIDIEPAGALTITEVRSTRNGWREYQVNGEKWGRARLNLTYADGLKQSINYKVIKPQVQVVEDLAGFAFARQWFDKPYDPFHRNPSVISYDDFEKEQVTEDNRVWIAGLSDEGGNGSWLGAVMKQLIQPDKGQVKKLQTFVDNTLWGGIQYSDGPQKYGVRKSMFYYEPDKMPKGTYSQDVHYGGWESWSEKQARSVGRSYNYPPVAAAYWVFYRLARNYKGLVTNHDWQWYLNQAYQTSEAMVKFAPYYAKFGQMEGTIFIKILNDLKREGWKQQAESLEKTMKKRAGVWKSLAYPFGSEMPWDSTGQEEVYAWCQYFGYEQKADVTLNAIIGYMPTVPHWGYNGSARRYWDFQYAGKLPRLERQLHHYGSGLNAIPVLTNYRNNPGNFHLLRIGYGGLMGAISNITHEGFGPCGFHAFPQTLKIDGYSGDYGPGFFGHVINAGTYVMNHPEFGWLSFGGNLKEKDEWIEVTPLDSARSRIYVASLGLWFTLYAGKFEKVRLNKSTLIVEFSIWGQDNYTPNAFLRISQPAGTKRQRSFKMEKNYAIEREAYIIPIKAGLAKVRLEVSS